MISKSAVSFVLCATTCLSTNLLASEMIDLGTFGGFRSSARGINDHTQVVGGAFNYEGAEHAFLWDKNVLHDLGTLGGTNSFANDVNNLGEIVGGSNTASEDWQWHAFFYTKEDGMIDLGTLGGKNSSALSINDQGQVVGYAETSAGHAHAFIWTKATGMVDMGTLGGTFSDATSINNHGQVVGRTQNSEGATLPYIWNANEGMKILGKGILYGMPQHINDRGEIVGYAQSTKDAYAFLWTAATGTIDLRTKKDWPSNSYANCINEAGVIGGGEIIGPQLMKAFTWNRNGGLADLGALGGVTAQTMSLNNRGEAVGWAGYTEGYHHAFLYRP